MIWVGKIQEAIDFIEGNLFEPINAEAVGKAINYAPSSFSIFFSAVTGYSVGEYIRFRRLSVSAERLADGKASVTDAAFECGYETVEAFSKAFKRLFGYAPSLASQSKTIKFAPISINFILNGGFSMTRNLIPGLRRVDWSDTQRQSEYVNSVVSALNGLGESTDYDYVCAVSGAAFSASFSKEGWDFGNQRASGVPIILEHTFKMFGYGVTRRFKSDFKTDSRLIMDSIDRGVPVITLDGVIPSANECLISGYDNEGEVLLGYNPFMDMEDDHDEPHDKTGYFRKTGWHEHMQNSMLIIGEKAEKPSKEAVFGETLKIIKKLIAEESLVPSHYNGLAAHAAFANALQTYQWDDGFEPYMSVMCTYKMYMDRRYTVKFFEDNGRGDLAGIYREIAKLCDKLGEIIPQDFSAMDMFGDKGKLKPYCDVLLEIRKLEEQALKIIG
ncbi:MAG: AraC family transcriptional regulator [Defluviitaleaceae bacterium]|nr:AraC family transcriptional regulator [Defluviitaleaceae bacterium]